MSLSVYNKKRNFKNTAEPSGKLERSGKLRFVIQRHYATRLHYDLRLEMDGVLKSWAVPKGPSLNSKDKRLAVMTEDHPVKYLTFKGIIPEGNYGAGVMEIWDAGTYTPVNEKSEAISEKQALSNLKKGELKFNVKGKQVSGEFVLVKLKNDEKNWLLIKHKDADAVSKAYDADKIEALQRPPGADEALKKKNDKKSASKEAKPDSAKTRAVAKNVVSKKAVEQLRPMLAETAKEAFSSENWLYEMKWDGYRAIAVVNDNDIQLYSRNGLDFSKKFAPVYAALDDIKHNCVLDGEIVLLNKEGHPDFGALQQYVKKPNNGKLEFKVFDLLMLNGQSTMELPLIQRKELLETLIVKKHKIICYSKHVVGDATGLIEKAQEHELEGVMAKEVNSIYRPGVRSRDWLKMKNIQVDDFYIAGYVIGADAAQAFRSLVLAQKLGREWAYRGHVGTGFNAQSAKELKQLMDAHQSKDSIFKTEVPVNGKVMWLEPKMKAKVTYTQLTSSGVVRHGAYMGVTGGEQSKKPKAGVKNKAEAGAEKKAVTSKKQVRLPESSKNKSTPQKSAPPKNTSTKTQPGVAETTNLKIATHNVSVSNSGKVYFPQDGITKIDVVNYYQAVSKFILPHLKNRPLSLRRHPNGIDGEAFYHKDAGEHAPTYVDTHIVRNSEKQKDIDYVVCNNAAALAWICNLGCIEMNPWNSLFSKPEHPSWLAIDLDPGHKNSFNDVIDAALVCNEILKGAGVDGYCKTSGASGLHVYVPLNNKYEYEVVKTFAQLVASLIVDQLPGTCTTERTISKRGGRMYVDFLQNRQGQTLASAYSIRPVPGAQVSTPLNWKEVKHGLTPADFTIHNAPARFNKLGDLFAPVLNKGVDLKKALKSL